MQTFWVLGKGPVASQSLLHDSLILGDLPENPMQRQTSQHSSLAAVVYGLMKANNTLSKQRNTATKSSTTSKFKTPAAFSPGTTNIVLITSWIIKHNYGLPFRERMGTSEKVDFSQNRRVRIFFHQCVLLFDPPMILRPSDILLENAFKVLY